jgi:bifunctional non-homologous end joining protein LigD
VRTRSGRDVAASVPHVAALSGSGLSVVLDGELVAGRGTPEDFYRLGAALARRDGRSGVAVTFVAFDLLWEAGELLIDVPHRHRRARLERLDLPGVPVMPSFGFDDAAHLFAATEAVGAEGIVLKDGAAVYTPGRRSARWRKVKTAEWRRHGERRFASRFAR